jgi:hypothetical protein
MKITITPKFITYDCVQSKVRDLIYLHFSHELTSYGVSYEVYRRINYERKEEHYRHLTNKILSYMLKYGERE